MLDTLLLIGQWVVALYVAGFGVAAALTATAGRGDSWASADEIRQTMRSIEWPQPDDPPEDIDTHLFNRRN